MMMAIAGALVMKGYVLIRLSPISYTIMISEVLSLMLRLHLESFKSIKLLFNFQFQIPLKIPTRHVFRHENIVIWMIIKLKMAGEKTGKDFFCFCMFFTLPTLKLNHKTVILHFWRLQKMENWNNLFFSHFRLIEIIEWTDDTQTYKSQRKQSSVFWHKNPFASVIPLVKTLWLKTAIQPPITQMLHLI